MQYPRAIASGPYVLYPRFAVAQELLSALQDDAERVGVLLDLTRPTDRSKQVRTARSGGGKPKAYYRNPWLQLRLRLVDGNTLRFSMVEKIKTKAGSVVRRSNKVAAKLSINGDLYTWDEALAGVQFRGYQVSPGPDHVLLSGYEADLQNLSEPLLGKIQTLFSHLEPVGSAAM